MDRRDFIKVAGASGAALFAMAMLGGCESLLQQIKNRPVRRNIATLANNDPTVEAFRAGVAAMKALPSGDPRNWTRQASIHNNFCPHGNWYFLPWHRAYLYYFETIVRQLSGYRDFALPYWNWTCQPQIPAHFFGTGNPLLDTTRTKSPADMVPAGMTGETVLEGILNIPGFEQFGSYHSTALRGGTGGGYGSLEMTPHNGVHGWVGGDMGTFMSPLDPLFWCHHNMVERCWWEWNITRGHPNPNSPDWSTLPLNGMFCDKDGNPVNNLTVAVTSLMPLLSYQFEDQMIPCAPVAGFSAIPRNMDSAALRKFLEKGGPFRLAPLASVKAETLARVVVQHQRETVIKLPNAVKQLVMAQAVADRRYVLKVGNAAVKDVNDVFVRLFINPPAGGALRGMESAHYAGSFAFFGDVDHAQHGASGTYYIDVTDTVKRLREKGLLKEGDELSVSLVAVSINDGQVIPRGHVELSDVEILLSKATPE